jgi:hypothetical protein
LQSQDIIVKKIKIIIIISLLGLFGLFFAFFAANAHAADADKHERPLIEDPTGEGDDSIDNEDETDVDERGIEDLDPWFFEDNGKNSNPTEQDTKEPQQKKEDQHKDLP